MESPQRDRAAAADLLDLCNKGLRGTDADAVDVHGDADVAVALVQDDGDAAVALVPGKEIPQALERRPVRRRGRQLDGHRFGEPFAHEADGHNHRAKGAGRLMVTLALSLYPHRD